MATEVVAKGKYIRGSAQKARIPAKAVKGMLALEALDVLKYMNKKAAGDVRKVVNSAIANATNNYGLQDDLLFVEDIRVDKAPYLKRYKFRSRGAGVRMVMKHHSHITVILKSLEEMLEESPEIESKSVKKSKDKDEKQSKNESKKDGRSEKEESKLKSKKMPSAKKSSTKKSNTKKTTKKKKS